jgi:hypothetical protein
MKTVKHPNSVMVWGCFSGSLGHCGLYFLPENTIMNDERCHMVLEDHLLQFMDIHGCTHFQQDSIPCLTSKCMKALLAESLL